MEPVETTGNRIVTLLLVAALGCSITLCDIRRAEAQDCAAMLNEICHGQPGAGVRRAPFPNSRMAQVTQSVWDGNSPTRRKNSGLSAIRSGCNRLIGTRA